MTILRAQPQGAQSHLRLLMACGVGGRHTPEADVVPAPQPSQLVRNYVLLFKPSQNKKEIKTQQGPGEATENHQIFPKVPGGPVTGDSQRTNLKSEVSVCLRRLGVPPRPPNRVSSSRTFCGRITVILGWPWCQGTALVPGKPAWCRQARHGTLENP